jgi:predicted dehydrogenase/threonine dehydrogenase-like Zn-dependent dehydrogenase
MKQILQNIKTGQTELIDVPEPLCRPGHVLIASHASLISVGTERMLVDFGKANWLEKARQQPEKVSQVLDKIRTDGILPTVEAVFNKLDEPMPLGYCNAGVVLEMGSGITNFQPGDRVASNGHHAEIVSVPRILCAKIPGGVSDDEAAFTVLGAIALQGVRLATPSLGERFVVFGLGLVGLLTVQLLRASGCPVLAVDVSPTRLRLAEAFGSETVDLGKGTDPVAAALAWTGGRGVDGVIIAASAKGDDIVHQAASACRKRGRIILVGVVDLSIRRSDFYEKELTFQVSCSYGPGRYDEKYEQAGQDYPFGFVRWTEQRNFEAVLEAMRTGQLRVKELITHRIPLDETAEAYDKVLHDPGALGIIIEYPSAVHENGDSPSFGIKLGTQTNFPGKFDHVPSFIPTVGVIGAGNFAKAILLPALVKTGANLAVVADINSVAAAHAARKFGIGKAVTDARMILDDRSINTVFVVVGHHLHARFVCDAIAAGKHVYVEKPLAITPDQLTEIIQTYEKTSLQHSNVGDGKIGTDSFFAPAKMVSVPFFPLLMVGFNRRFSPHIVKIKELLAGRTEPLTMSMTINSGFIPPEHWVQDPQRGGGRIIGEGCHFIDLLMFLSGSPVTSVSAMMVGGIGPVREDRMSILLGFADGSVGTVHYFANGSKSYPKETLEVFGDGRVIRMENFRFTKGYGFKGFKSFRTWRQDKGHRAEITAFVERVSAGGASLIPFEQIVNVTQASFAAVESAKTNKTIQVLR